MEGLAGAAELVVLPVEEAEPGRDASIHESGEHLQPLLQGAAIVLVGMDEQGGGLYVFGILQGGLGPEGGRVVVKVSPGLVGGKVAADVGDAAEAEPVRYGPLGRAAAEPVRMADDPVGHEAAVAAAGLADPLGVDGGIGRQDRVTEGHEVLIVHVPVAAPDVRKCIVAAVAALGVAEEDEVPLPRPVLHLMIEHGPVDGLGTAVDIEHRRIPLGGIIPEGLEDPTLDGEALTLYGEGLRLGNIAVLNGGAVEVGEAFRLPGGEIAKVQLLGPHIIETHAEGLPVRHIEAVHGAGLGEHGGIGPIHVQAIEDRVPAPGGQVVEAVPCRHALPAAAQTHVAAHAVVQAVFRRKEDLPLAGDRVDLIHVVVFVEAVALALAAEEEQMIPHGLQMGEHQGIGGEKVPGRSRPEVSGFEGEFLQQHLWPPLLGSVEDLVVKHRKAAHVLPGAGDRRDGQRVQGDEEQPSTLAVDDPRPVGPEGKLVENLIVLVVLLLLQDFPTGLLVRGIEIGMILVKAPHRQEPLFIQHLQLADGKGHREEGQSFAAVEIQHVIGREGLLRFRPLLLRGGANGGKDEPIVVQPEIAPLLAQIGELLHLAVLIEPQPGFVAVFRFVGRGDHEGRPGMSGIIPRVRKKTIVQDVLLLDGFHAHVLSRVVLYETLYPTVPQSTR